MCDVRLIKMHPYDAIHHLPHRLGVQVLGRTRVTVRQIAATGCEERWYNLEHMHGDAVIGTDTTGGAGWHTRGAHKRLFDWSNPAGVVPLV